LKILNTMYYFSRTSIERINQLDRRYLKDILHTAIKVSPIDFGIPAFGGKRTAEQQFELYKKGRKKILSKWKVINPTKVVTNVDGYANKSYHQSGMAFDVVAYVDGKYTWDAYYMGIIAGVILAVAEQQGIGLTWGATFGNKGSVLKGWDKGHYQV
jgi:hypothetical protein